MPEHCRRPCYLQSSPSTVVDDGHAQCISVIFPIHGRVWVARAIIVQYYAVRSPQNDGRAERSGAWPGADNRLISGTYVCVPDHRPYELCVAGSASVWRINHCRLADNRPPISSPIASHRSPVPLLLHSGRRRTICPWNSPLQFAVAADRPPIPLKPSPADDISCLICILRADERNQPAVHDAVFTRPHTAVRPYL